MQRIATVPDNLRTSIDRMNLASTIGLTSPAMEEFKRMDEMPKLCVASDYIKSAMDKLNVFPDIGISSFALEEKQRALTVPSDIAGRVIDNMTCIERINDFSYLKPSYTPVDIPIIRPLSDPMHKTNKILEKHEQHQAKTNSHLEKIALQGEGTSKQNDKMLFWAKVAAIATIAGLLVAIGFQAGQNSSTPTPSPAPVVKAAPAPVVPTILAPAPVNSKK